MSIELEIYSCSICGASYVWKDDAINCHKQEKCCGAVEFEGPYPAFACGSCGKHFVYKSTGSWLTDRERKTEAQTDANLCCDKDAPINRTGEKLDNKPE